MVRQYLSRMYVIWKIHWFFESYRFIISWSLVQEQIDSENKNSEDVYVYDVYYRDDTMDLDDQINFNNIATLYVDFLN